MLYIAACSKKE